MVTISRKFRLIIDGYRIATNPDLITSNSYSQYEIQNIYICKVLLSIARGIIICFLF